MYLHPDMGRLGVGSGGRPNESASRIGRLTLRAATPFGVGAARGRRTIDPAAEALQTFIEMPTLHGLRADLLT
jgi:hypothetical protein